MDVAVRDGRSVRPDSGAITVGLAVLGLGMLAVRDGAVSDVEEYEGATAPDADLEAVVAGWRFEVSP
jgi:hypothetical protein